jgi:nitroreductase
MGLSRRAFVRILGGTAVFAAATGMGLSQCDRMPAVAVEGWNGPASSETEPRRRALSYALLAPNPHNRQSWIADLRTPGEIALYVDTTRMLPMTDPFGRQVLIGCGCFLETLVLAAGAEGWAAETTLLPDGFDETDAGAKAFARVRLSSVPKADPDGLAAAILQRRSAKVTYAAGQALDAGHESGLRAVHRDADVALTITSDAGMVAALRTIALEAFRIEVDTDRTYRESVELMRIGAEEIARHRDGLELHGPFYWWLKQFGLLSVEEQMRRGSTARETARTFLDADAASTSTFAWIATAGNGREAQLRAGRAYVRLNLACTQLGVAMAPWSQVLQEYPEMAATQSGFLKTVGAAPNATVQMFFRLGYAAAPEPTPRRALDDIVRA